MVAVPVETSPDPSSVPSHRVVTVPVGPAYALISRGDPKGPLPAETPPGDRTRSWLFQQPALRDARVGDLARLSAGPLRSRRDDYEARHGTDPQDPHDEVIATGAFDGDDL